MGATLSLGLTFHTLDCPSCYITFALETGHIERLRKNGKTFCCPTGHNMSYGDSVEDKLKVERDRLKRQLELARSGAQWTQDQLDAAVKERTVLKGQLTKTKKRIANGVCPCCHRNFADVKRHMDNKHPDYAKESVDA